MTRYDMSQQQSEVRRGPESARTRILRAAEALFAERGYARTTTRAVAARAGVNEVTLFRLFGSKLLLLRAVLAEAAVGGLRALADGQLTGDYRADLLRLGRDEVANMLQWQSAVRLLVCEAAHDPELHAAVAGGSSRNQAMLAAYFDRQIAAGVVRRGLDPAVLAHAFFSLTSSYVMQRVLLGAVAVPGLSWEAVVEQLVDLFVRGTARGVLP